MFTVMHISDLHRSPSDPIGNDELLSCLIADRDRFSTESPQIRLPDAVIVTGDLVQGLGLGHSGYPLELQKQYEQALDFLIRLADTFTGGDRAKIVFIPGNHDVDWNLALSAMEKVDSSGQDVRGLLSRANTPYRWSWKELQLYRVSKAATYEKRFDYFCETYQTFYSPASMAFPLDPHRPWNLFQLDNGNVVLAAFNSCFNNDCFSYFGEIAPEGIAQTHLELLATRTTPRLKMAVWHHDIQGAPSRSDYMDADSVRLMVDKGFRLGLHGHRHRSNTFPYSLFTSQEHTMAVVSTGSLCAGPNDLPTGTGRQYNIIEIADNYMSARIHVREMNVPGVFSAGRLISLGGTSFTDVKWTGAPPAALVNTARSGGHALLIVEQVEQLIGIGAFADAIQLIDSSHGRLRHYGRQLLTKALFGSGDWGRLAAHLHDPQNSEEFVYRLKALVASRNWPEAEQAIQQAENDPRIARNAVSDIGKWLKEERGLGK
jgi:hypothetical protein